MPVATLSSSLRQWHLLRLVQWKIRPAENQQIQCHQANTFFSQWANPTWGHTGWNPCVLMSCLIPTSFSEYLWQHGNKSQLQRRSLFWPTDTILPSWSWNTSISLLSMNEITAAISCEWPYITWYTSKYLVLCFAPRDLFWCSHCLPDSPLQKHRQMLFLRVDQLAFLQEDIT